MSLSLRETQNAFSKALHYQASGEECSIVSDQFSADDRMQIYRNNFVIGYTEILTLTYPLVLALVGEECFNALSRQHILTTIHPEGDVSSYGSGFAETIESISPVISAVPYLADVARLEWAMDLSQQVNNQTRISDDVIPLAAMATLPIDQQSNVALLLDSRVQLLSSSFAIFSIRSGVIEQELDDIEPLSSEQGFVQVVSHDDIKVSTLPKEVFLLLKAIEDHTPLADIDTELLPYLQHVLAEDLITGFQLSDIPEAL